MFQLGPPINLTKPKVTKGNSNWGSDCPDRWLMWEAKLTVDSTIQDADMYEQY